MRSRNFRLALRIDASRNSSLRQPIITGGHSVNQVMGAVDLMAEQSRVVSDSKLVDCVIESRLARTNRYNRRSKPRGSSKRPELGWCTKSAIHLLE